MPSFRAMLTSLPLTPIVTISSRLAPGVRSPPTDSHVWPRFDERNTRLAPAKMTAELWGDMTSGVSPFPRNGGSPGGGIGPIATCPPPPPTPPSNSPSHHSPHTHPKH